MNIKSDNVSGSKQAPLPVAQEDVTVTETVSLTVAQLALDNVISLAMLPAYCDIVGYKLYMADLDGATSLITDLGVINATEDGISVAAAEGGNELIDGQTLGRSAGIIGHDASAASWLVTKAVQPVTVNRAIGLAIKAAPGTPQAGDVTLELTYRNAR